jgi:alkane 1-monooxygenase
MAVSVAVPCNPGRSSQSNPGRGSHADEVSMCLRSRHGGHPVRGVMLDAVRDVVCPSLLCLCLMARLALAMNCAVGSIPTFAHPRDESGLKSFRVLIKDRTSVALVLSPSIGSPAALLRLLPLLFPAVFVTAAVTGSISVLYAAVALHVIIIGAENTVGRLLSKTSVAPLQTGSTFFEEVCVLAWPALHFSALAAAFYLIAVTEPTTRQTFAIGAIFGYSINIFSATAGHELIHRRSRVGRICADALYAAMLYPHFPAVHLASHHRWAGSGRDCQTPRPGEQIHPYLWRALVGGLSTASTARAVVLDPHLPWRVLAAFLAVVAFGLIGAWPFALFLIVQGLFAFIIVETLNYIQHYNPASARSSTGDEWTWPPNQDLNFVSRCTLLNLPLHAAHHLEPNVHYSRLVPISQGASCSWGYWTSFWLAWTPPLWKYLKEKERGVA